MPEIAPALPAALAPCRAALEADPARYLDLTEPVRRGEGKVLSASPEGALVSIDNYDRDGTPRGFSLWCAREDAGEALLDLISGPVDLLFYHDDFCTPLIARRFGLTAMGPCRQAGYFRREPPPLPQTPWEVRALGREYLDVLTANYGYGDGEYLSWLIGRGELFGAFDGGELLGFMGRHAEGSLGLLEVLPGHRRKGVAFLLQRWMLRRELGLGHIPFGQVFADNAPSLALQERLGMTFAQGPVYFALGEM